MPINNGFYNRPDEDNPGPQEPVFDLNSERPQGITPPANSRRTGSRSLILFGFCILFILGVTVVLLLLNEGNYAKEPLTAYPMPTQDAPMLTMPPDQPTTVARAPLGGDTAMTIIPAPVTAPLSFQEIYRRNVASVVSVRGSRDGGGSLGTGVILSEDGYIITNAHVIEGCSEVSITLQNNSIFPALLVGSDAESDLAVLKIDTYSLPPAQFGDSDALVVGDVALAIGNPLGEKLRGTMTDGIISAINRDVVVDGRNMVLLQTTAALNSGSSGGALINVHGQVVGITSLKMISNYDTIEGLGFAIPTSTVKNIVDELIQSGHIGGRPTIGVVVATLTAETAAYYGVPQGVRVDSVEERSDAFAQGLKVGDVIVEANGQSVLSGNDLNAIKNPLSVGDTITLKIYRDGDYFTLQIKLVEKYILDG